MEWINEYSDKYDNSSQRPNRHRNRGTSRRESRPEPQLLPRPAQHPNDFLARLHAAAIGIETSVRRNSAHSISTAATVPLLDDVCDQSTRETAEVATQAASEQTASVPVYHTLSNGNDVVFIFPFEKYLPSPPLLWARKSELLELSPAFETWFQGDELGNDNHLTEASKFTEVCIKDVTRIVDKERGRGQRKQGESSDSDIEEEEGGHSHKDKICKNLSASILPTPIYFVTIRDTAYKTFEAFLKWHSTGDIAFAPLTSAKSSSISSNVSGSCSPKSTYKLAHQFGIKALEDAAATNFASQLSHVNVLDELFSSSCYKYPVLKAMAMKVLEREWGKVREAGGLDKVLEVVESDKGDAKEMMKIAVGILRKASQLDG